MLAVLVLGPEKLPEYTRKLTEWIRTLRRMAEGAKEQFKDETGTDFDEIDWRRYDPRQYDPRRIIREALSEPVDASGSGASGAGASGSGGSGTGQAPARRPSGARDAVRNDLAAVRSERDALREDLKEMDPRALFFGSSGRRTTTPALGAATGSATADGGPATDATDAVDAEAEAQDGPQGAGSRDTATLARVSPNAGPQDAGPQGAGTQDADASDAAERAAAPAPFDPEAT
ncbi:MAG TPA: Sec-independent protein translocase TatB [Citricoccus sp.]